MSKYNVQINFRVDAQYEEEIEADSQEEAERLFKEQLGFIEVYGSNVAGSVEEIEVNGCILSCETASCVCEFLYHSSLRLL